MTRRWVLSASCGQRPDLPWTGEATTADDRLAMASVCGQCPVMARCAEWAGQVRPVAGFWAGRDYSTPNRPTFLQDALNIDDGLGEVA